MPYRRTSAVGGPLARFWWHDAPADSSGNEQRGGSAAWPCQKPPWGELMAVDAATGEIAWRVPLGLTEQLPERKRRTGRLNVGGPIVTAAGLLFVGASDDRRFRAFDSRTGAELWVTEVPLSAHAVPITYAAADGRQYVAIVAAGRLAIDDAGAAGAESLIAYALP
jgi:quinoprotein glucose dehydrogenase